ncbi:MAG TPA: wax ester/triacylglycerol synthase domain-containing protein [Candidatus Dormibacteraeota bacterium]|nr:wax ester/triacylglycerol synthase domain-containing protein [Candidatus Dormibacteraeota bacterium]
MQPSSRLTALEASFLNIERANLPMHIAARVDLEPDGGAPIAMRELRRHVAARAARLPRFQQRIVADPLGLWPRWSEPEPVELDAHLYHHEVSSEAAVARLLGELHSDLLPRHRPLWEIHLVDSPGRQALLVKVHHAIADGIGGVHIARTLFDAVGAAEPLLPCPHREPAPALVRAGQALLGAAFTIAGGPIARPSRFNLAVGRDRVVAFATIPMEQLVALKHEVGGSIDDVVLAAVALAIRDSHLAAANGMSLRAMIPVSTWAPGSDGAAGNHVSAIFVDLPQDTRDLGEIVARVSSSKSVLRGAHAAAAMSLGIEALGLLPGPVHGAAVRFTTTLPFANLVVSDTPGPPEGLHLLGRRIAACYPLIPLPATVGLSIAALSVGGVMGVGVVADPRAVAEPERLAQAIERAVSGPRLRARRSRTQPRVRAA